MENNESHEMRHEIRSEAMEEILSKKSGFLVRWSLFIFIVILGCVVAGAWLLEYPEILHASATISGTNIPKEVISKQEGKVVKIFTQNSEPVKKDQVVLWLESSAKHSEVLNLSILLDSANKKFDTGSLEDINGMFTDQFANLGELQQGYQVFLSAYQQFCDYIENGYYIKKRGMVFDDIKNLDKTKETILEQKELLENDLKLSEETFKANEKLYKDKVISELGLREEKSKLMGKQMTIPQINTALLNIQVQMQDKRREIVDLDHAIFQQKSIFESSVHTMQSEIAAWRYKYLVVSPIEGFLFYSSPIQENQYIKNGTLLGFVNPVATDYYAEMTVPQQNFGKVQVGQPVQLRLLAYPYEEFGHVNGTISFISPFASDSGFIARVKISNQLVSNKQKIIQYKNGLKAEALIITKNMNLLQRLFYSIIRQINK